MKQAPVLYVEDDENDAWLVRYAFERAEVTAPLEIVNDGRQAIEYLSGTGQFAERSEHPLPALVLLDLNLPVMNGFEVLTWLRAQPAMATLPVVIFSSSSQPQDLERAKALGANDYIVKPVNMGRLEEMIQRLESRWLREACAARPGALRE